VKNFKQTVVKALLPHIILNEAAQQPIHGYAIITMLRKTYGVYLGPSTVYPTLLSLEREGLIEAKWQAPNPTSEKPRKVYSLTVKGRMLLGQTSAELMHITKTVEVKTA
jgi:DNA-binding PadR family transcriptional regulator